MDADNGYDVLLAFDVDDPAFVRGFEIGRVWQLLRDKPGEEIVETLHASNAEMILRLAEATSRSVRTEELDDTWVAATFSAAVESLA